MEKKRANASLGSVLFSPARLFGGESSPHLRRLPHFLAYIGWYNVVASHIDPHLQTQRLVYKPALLPTLSLPSLPSPLTAQAPMDKFTYKDWQTLLAICDGFVPAVDPSVIEPLVDENFTGRVDELAALTPSSLPRYKQSLELTLRANANEKIVELGTLVRMLNHRSVAFLLTRSRKLFTEMTAEEKQKVLLSWHNSRLWHLNKLFRSLFDMSVATYLRINPLNYEAIGHPERIPGFDKIDFESKFRHQIVQLGEHATEAQLDTDVVIIGSGSGAGVAASRLARSGYRVLILERGKYYHQSEMNFNEDEAALSMFENGGALVTEDGSMTVQAGATLGGGSTVNWSASLRTPQEVRKQWAEHVPWYNEKVYDKAMDHVMEQMGCSTDYLRHSKANQIIINGCEKLGWHAADVPQNTGRQTHNCGQCCHGCPDGVKQGGVVNWLRDAAEHGALILDQCSVMKITHARGRATGVQALVKDRTRLKVRAQKVIVAAGSLQTPGVLQRSQFKNKKIGRGLKLHPVTVVLGQFGTKLEGIKDPILTAVSTKFADLDGRQHGPRIETIAQQPVLESHFIPWKSGEQLRQDLLRYNHTAAMLVITRDRGSGDITFKPDQPFLPRVDYTTSKYDCWALQQGVVGVVDLLYIQGALRILPPMSTVPVFETNKPVSDRTVEDQEYVAWKQLLSNAVIKPIQTPMGSAHQMASCRMSASDPSYPLFQTGALRECKNVFVADASTLPSASGVNPMISTMATAHVIAGFVEQELEQKNIKLIKLMQNCDKLKNSVY